MKFDSYKDEERAAILEYDAGFSREEAEERARRISLKLPPPRKKPAKDEVKS